MLSALRVLSHSPSGLADGILFRYYALIRNSFKTCGVFFGHNTTYGEHHKLCHGPATLVAIVIGHIRNHWNLTGVHACGGFYRRQKRGEEITALL
jgi:hypothetical protein